MSAGKAMSAVELLQFQDVTDQRGSLLALEQLRNIPFEIKRVYCIYGVSPKEERGFHAHLELEQVAFCLSGSVTIDVEYSKGKERFALTNPAQGLYMGGLVWREMKAFSEDAVLMVIASDYYDEGDYVREYENFKVRLSRLKEQA